MFLQDSKWIEKETLKLFHGLPRFYMFFYMVDRISAKITEFKTKELGIRYAWILKIFTAN